MWEKILFFIVLIFPFFHSCEALKKGNGDFIKKNGVFFQIDRDMNEPPYSVINVFYTESLLDDNLLNQLEKERKMGKYKTQNYFRKSLDNNKYFMEYSRKQKEQLEFLLE
ncbi:hypothetical protein PFUGPA_01776 [Plasmodium falciparum Palo Alto/Uganda]|uniref:LIMP protein, putative n=8 Tax=Plasmodium falciparum TaxID=5833 RepID=Q8I5X2_PLAF7|nr:LIMP protein, putative [Plasmodium falciparum 3D7]ETW17680.1 hypothetical protein PFFVO_03330 [Plasmodium falciparum Vietnam Oak-Knoll (FVO)]ETW56257.1 hypothetical protein PFUGPA_01776 [Plasmodium falciparum Palo Alto/Uganda]ETW60365.1 hypothetical protein PFMC_03646 [Plasmodium falciparum CAMP/Malaysia]EUR69216.1 hypothetical protein PFBG_03770 [Plasmodium falciparum 7G8]KAF4327076.1 hypothetical protein CYL21_4548 [Plasmodium falciparum NF54]KOB61908.1 hypothetical protein PFHG_03657 [P|eukprot:XP_001350482.2 conserved Plasmodium protein, unknown function [Plasmodium falciparum 3D7]